MSVGRMIGSVFLLVTNGSNWVLTMEISLSLSLSAFQKVSKLDTWVVHMAVYDEDLLKNPFYLAMQKRRPDLCRKVAEFHGIVSKLDAFRKWVLQLGRE